MASSSDWITALRDAGAGAGADAQAGANARPPAWMVAAPGRTAFVEGFPVSVVNGPEANPGATPSPPDRSAEQSPTSAPIPAALAPAATVPAADPIADAHAKGFDEGRAAAQAEHDAANERARALRLTFQTLDRAASEALAEELRDTVEALCEAAIASFEPDAADLLARCRSASQRIGQAAQSCALHLHPDDIAMIDQADLTGWTVRADDSVARGGLRFEGPDGSVLDGPGQWRRAIAAALRGES